MYRCSFLQFLFYLSDFLASDNLFDLGFVKGLVLYKGLRQLRTPLSDKNGLENG